MIRLNKATGDKLEIVLAGAVTTNQLDCLASCREMAMPTIPERFKTFVVQSNNGTDVTLVATPTDTDMREVSLININNSDTVSATVTVKLTSGGTEFILKSSALNAGQVLKYSNAEGWQVE